MDSAKLLFAVFVIACAGALTGCASVPTGSLEEDLLAKGLLVRPDKAQIYVYRHETLGFAIPMTIAIDGRAVGRTVSQTYVAREVDPGIHEVTSYAEDVSGVKVNAEAGKAYYVWQEVKIGLWRARSLLHAVDEETGRRGVTECKPVSAPATVAVPSTRLAATR
jgi:hypothetical protein